MKRLSEMPPAPKFREIYSKGPDDIPIAIKSMFDEVYRLGTDLAALKAKQIEKRLDDKLLAPHVWVVRKGMTILGVYRSHDDAIESGGSTATRFTLK